MFVTQFNVTSLAKYLCITVLQYFLKWYASHSTKIKLFALKWQNNESLLKSLFPLLLSRFATFFMATSVIFISLQICGWGRSTFIGYLNKDSECKDTFTEDHWLKLGNLGYLDQNRFLTVLGAPDSFITLKSGDVISPQKVRKLPEKSRQFSSPLLHPKPQRTALKLSSGAIILTRGHTRGLKMGWYLPHFLSRFVKRTPNSGFTNAFTVYAPLITFLIVSPSPSCDSLQKSRMTTTQCFFGTLR